MHWPDYRVIEKKRGRVVGTKHLLQRAEPVCVGDHTGFGTQLCFGDVPEPHDKHVVAKRKCPIDLPAQILDGERARAFAGGAPVLRDPQIV